MGLYVFFIFFSFDSDEWGKVEAAMLFSFFLPKKRLCKGFICILKGEKMMRWFFLVFERERERERERLIRGEVVVVLFS